MGHGNERRSNDRDRIPGRRWSDRRDAKVSKGTVTSRVVFSRNGSLEGRVPTVDRDFTAPRCVKWIRGPRVGASRGQV